MYGDVRRLRKMVEIVRLSERQRCRPASSSELQHFAYGPRVTWNRGQIRARRAAGQRRQWAPCFGRANTVIDMPVAIKLIPRRSGSRATRRTAAARGAKRRPSWLIRRSCACSTSGKTALGDSFHRDGGCSRVESLAQIIDREGRLRRRRAPCSCCCQSPMRCRSRTPRALVHRGREARQTSSSPTTTRDNCSPSSSTSASSKAGA